MNPLWQNWEPVSNLGPTNLADAPVFLTIGPDNYWVFGRYGGKRKNNKPMYCIYVAIGQKKAAVAYGGGIHPKHRHMRYHDFFVNRILLNSVVILS